MKIGPLDPRATAAAVAGDRPGPQGTDPSASPQAAESAQVRLSAAATALGESSPEFDAAKVQRIAQAIRDGRFEVHPEAIAERLIANARELLERPAH